MAAPAVLKALEQVWLALEPLNLPMAVMGGLALAAWKYPRSTRDVDLVITLGARSPQALVDRLAPAHFRPRNVPAIRSLGTAQILQLSFEPHDALVAIPIDLLLVTSEYHQTALARRVPFQILELVADLHVLSCEDLLLHKLTAGRIIDRSDAAALIRANRQTLDVAYIHQWGSRLGLKEEVREVWNEACPSELPPL